ncbi:xkdS protein (endogenous virus) [Clostridium phage phiCT453B]|uniref:DUF2634 domain-containing protein n=1 Tax=Clostridium phage phiCT453B TaxID=1567013 RepID=UPI00051382B5|nr:DUF2634 domain-containing protein [Clostridium tetani]YP_009217945.1 DUF2634 domain-containing protein [Clostridium phage phiCT453B]AJA42601.1 xkdS protein [Clostridium phage phiCT453B]KGI45320.1 hypothetical protein KY55_01425 [Clostridium tetani]
MSIFPEGTEEVNEIIETSIEKNGLPLFKEYAINLNTGEMIYKDGKNVIIEGNEALKIWIHYALKTTKNRYKVYSNNYGNEFEKIIGKVYSKELVDSERERDLVECLTVNPYIKSVDDVKINFEGSKLTVHCTVITVYGEMEFNYE